MDQDLTDLLYRFSVGASVDACLDGLRALNRPSIYARPFNRGDRYFLFVQCADERDVAEIHRIATEAGAVQVGRPMEPGLLRGSLP